ncbi:MAG: hypothetical protein B6V02_03340 [Thermoprotei archaeon ex4572_64]|nr:MAG: hypothetical protein B6V02_03340 [Thermoprotei archaeon ex4572_64]
MNKTTNKIELLRKYCTSKLENEVLNRFSTLEDMIKELKMRYEADIRAEWHVQKMRNGTTVAYELRIYFISPKATSTQIANETVEKLRRLGYGACRRPKDTFVTVRKGKEELAIIFHKLGILKELIPKNAPEKVKQNIEKELKKFEQGVTIYEVPEEELYEFYNQLVEYINDRFQKLAQEYKNEEKALKEIKKEFQNTYIKLSLTINEIRKRIQENEDYITWLTICDAVISMIVDDNVDLLVYGSTTHELPTIVTKTLGFIKLSITGKDNKSEKLHVVVTCSNYIAKELFNQEIPEIDNILRKVRDILNTAKSVLVHYLKALKIELEENTKISEVNKILKELYTSNRITFEELKELAEMYKGTIAQYVKEPIRALAGEIDGDGFVEKRGENDYGVGISFAPYTVKGFATLLLLKYLEARKLLMINDFSEAGLSIKVWLLPNTRKDLINFMNHPERLNRMELLSKKSTINMILKSIVDISNVITAVKDMLNLLNRYGIDIRGELKIWHDRGSRTLKLCLSLIRRKGDIDVRLIDVADKVVEVLKRHGLSARRHSKSAIIEISKGKIELAYILSKLNLLEGTKEQLKRYGLTKYY